MEPVFSKIYVWYHSNKRDLPWRETSDPYKIWISEIILQQTKIDQGLNYYLRFIERFPTINELANAPEDEILKLWQGLGYYSRARNLHHAAKEICEKHNSKLPDSYKELLKLKGIGTYTAAAIASIAFQLPKATVDGNVYRLLSRYFGIFDPINSPSGVKVFQEIAEELMEKQDPGMHNQALMEFGAVICKPKIPNCIQCPMIETCYAHGNNKIEELPVKLKKIKQSTRYFYYLFIENQNSLYIKQRSDKDIWRNLYELPLIEMNEDQSIEKFLQSIEFSKIIKNSEFLIQEISQPIKHILSHQIIYATFIHMSINQKNELPTTFIPINRKDISKFAIHKLMEIYFKRKGLL